MVTSKAQENSTAAKKDLSRYALILGNFTNLRNVATLSENQRFVFTPPKESHSWKGPMTGEISGPFLALEPGKNMYMPGRWIIGASDDLDQCDMQIAEVGDNSGISRQHLRIDLDVQSRCPRLTQFSSRNLLAVVVHEKRRDRNLFLGQTQSVKIETGAPITVNFGTCSFQAWRPTLTPDEENRYHQHLELHFRDYLDTMPVFPSIQSHSGAETPAVRFGQNGTVYKQGEHLGRGTNATVHLVEEAISGKVYAAKEPYYKASDTNAEVLKRFNRLEAEFKMLQQLEHSHIVKAVELVLDQNRQLPPWMIMEYIEDNLDCALTRLKGAKGLIIVRQLIGAVQFMHAKNYVHRDIKPGNILIQWADEQPVLKMADVGTMKEDEDLKTFTGTPLYMAPECWDTAQTAQRYSKKVDMWAVGLVLLQLFTDWDPKKDNAWVNSGPFGKTNRLGFPGWISKVLIPFIRTAIPQSVQPLLRGLLCESPQDRWSAARCQMWMEDSMPHVESYVVDKVTSRKRSRDEDEDTSKPREVRSCNPTLDTTRAELAGNVVKLCLYRLQHELPIASDSSLPDTLPWDARYDAEQDSGSEAVTPTQAPSSSAVSTCPT